MRDNDTYHAIKRYYHYHATGFPVGYQQSGQMARDRAVIDGLDPYDRDAVDEEAMGAWEKIGLGLAGLILVGVLLVIGGLALLFVEL